MIRQETNRIMCFYLLNTDLNYAIAAINLR